MSQGSDIHFECVDPQSAYYVDSVITMLEDTLMDRDLVHHQMGSVIVKRLALGYAVSVGVRTPFGSSVHNLALPPGEYGVL